MADMLTLEDLNEVFTFRDAQKAVAEIATLQVEAAASLAANESEEVKAYWRGRQEMAMAMHMVLDNEKMTQLYVSKWENRLDEESDDA